MYIYLWEKEREGEGERDVSPNNAVITSGEINPLTPPLSIWIKSRRVN